MNQRIFYKRLCAYVSIIEGSTEIINSPLLAPQTKNFLSLETVKQIYIGKLSG